MNQEKIQSNRPKVLYRVELEKKIQINRSHSDRRNQAIAMRVLSYGLFGNKRYHNLYLSCSLNCFFYALKIANTIHQRVAGLAMIIKFEKVKVLEYYAEPYEGKNYLEKTYSKMMIQLTKSPSENDRAEPGYNAGLSEGDIKQPLTEVLTNFSRRNFFQKKRFDQRGNYNKRNQYNNRRNYQDRRNPDNKGEFYHDNRRYGDDRDQRRIRKYKYEEIEGQTHQYKKVANNSRKENDDRSKNYAGKKPIVTNRHQEQDRGERMPKSGNRYDDDSDE